MPCGRTGERGCLSHPLGDLTSVILPPRPGRGREHSLLTLPHSEERAGVYCAPGTQGLAPPFYGAEPRMVSELKTMLSALPVGWGCAPHLLSLHRPHWRRGWRERPLPCPGDGAQATGTNPGPAQGESVGPNKPQRMTFRVPLTKLRLGRVSGGHAEASGAAGRAQRGTRSRPGGRAPTPWRSPGGRDHHTPEEP